MCPTCISFADILLGINVPKPLLGLEHMSILPNALFSTAKIKVEFVEDGYAELNGEYSWYNQGAENQWNMFGGLFRSQSGFTGKTLFVKNTGINEKAGTLPEFLFILVMKVHGEHKSH